MLAEILSRVEGPDADHHRVERRELLGGEVRITQLGDGVAHQLETGGHVVARAGQVTDSTAANREIERDRLQDCWRLKELEWNVVVVELDTLIVESRAVHRHARLEPCRGGLSRRCDHEDESRVLPRRGQMKRL